VIKSTRRGIIHLAFALAASTAMGTFATTAAQAQDKILLIINGALGDKSFFDSAAKGMKMIKDKYGDDVETKILEIGDDPTKWEPVFLDASEQDWDLIIGGTYQMSETVGSVAQQYPDKKYILYDASVPYEEGGYDNVYSIQYKQNEGSYLGGMLAASLLKAKASSTDSGKNLGFLGGMDIPVINDFLVGYIAGAQSVTPDIKIAISYVGSFMDAAKGKELGLAQYRSDVRSASVVASQTGLGQLSAAKETGKYVLGVDSDQEAIFKDSDPAIAKQVVSSVLKNVDVSLLQAYDQFAEGKLDFGTAATAGPGKAPSALVEGPAIWLRHASPQEMLDAIKQLPTKIASEVQDHRSDRFRHETEDRQRDPQQGSSLIVENPAEKMKAAMLSSPSAQSSPSAM
jgi:basic membrane protein A